VCELCCRIAATAQRLCCAVLCCVKLQVCRAVLQPLLRVTEEGIQGLASLSQLRSLSFGYTSMPEADQVAADIATQFKELTGESCAGAG
jgi:hypothetical protein